MLLVLLYESIMEGVSIQMTIPLGSMSSLYTQTVISCKRLLLFFLDITNNMQNISFFFGFITDVIVYQLDQSFQMSTTSESVSVKVLVEFPLCECVGSDRSSSLSRHSPFSSKVYILGSVDFEFITSKHADLCIDIRRFYFRSLYSVSTTLIFHAYAWPQSQISSISMNLNVCQVS